MILVGLTTNCAKTQEGSSDAVLVPCVIQLVSGCTRMSESDIAQEHVL
jgi:hypothetical protein